jgi:hypothetical protein
MGPVHKNVFPEEKSYEDGDIARFEDWNYIHHSTSDFRYLYSIYMF